MSREGSLFAGSKNRSKNSVPLSRLRFKGLTQFHRTFVPHKPSKVLAPGTGRWRLSESGCRGLPREKRDGTKTGDDSGTQVSFRCPPSSGSRGDEPQFHPVPRQKPPYIASFPRLGNLQGLSPRGSLLTRTCSELLRAQQHWQRPEGKGQPGAEGSPAPGRLWAWLRWAGPLTPPRKGRA